MLPAAAYAGSAPLTRASGKSRVVLSWHVRNRRLTDAGYLWAFSALTKSPGDTHSKALRRRSNELVVQLHRCLTAGQSYDESLVATDQPQRVAA